MTQKNKHIIYENENYTVEVATSDDNVGGTSYHVINKHTGVVEREDSVWPSAVQAAKFFNEEILNHEEDEEKDIPLASVIPISTH